MALAPVKMPGGKLYTAIVQPMPHDVLSAGAASKQRINSIASWIYIEDDIICM